MRKMLMMSGIGLCVFAIFLFVEFFLFLKSVPTHDQRERIITIEKGAPFLSIVKQLKREGIVTHEVKFYFLARWKGNITKIKAGEYLLHTNLKPTEVLEALVSGRTYLHRVTIPEGYNIYQIADVVQSLSLVTREDFLRAAKDPIFLEELRIQGPSVEGYLFPESYFFSKPVTAEKIIKTMVSKFEEHYTEEIDLRAKKRGFSKKKVIILAAIIEKETGVAEERRLISAVFHNRLKKGMKLQSDPTVIYGIYEGFSGNLRKGDLLTSTPYNTYVKEGLPLGPIANPGMDSLKAAVDPVPVNYLYFVSKNDGSHIFSDNYRDHLKAVNLHQKKR